MAWPNCLRTRRVLQRLLERALGDAERQRGDADATVVERPHEIDEARAFLAEPVLGRDLDVFHDQLAGVRRAPSELVLLLAGAEAGHRGK